MLYLRGQNKWDHPGVAYVTVQCTLRSANGPAADTRKVLIWHEFRKRKNGIISD